MYKFCYATIWTIRKQVILERIKSETHISINERNNCIQKKSHGGVLLKSFKLSRRNHRRCSVKKGVLRNFAKFTGTLLCQNLFFNKVAKFSCEFCKISKNTFFYRTPPGDCFLLLSLPKRGYTLTEDATV